MFSIITWSWNRYSCSWARKETAGEGEPQITEGELLKKGSACWEKGNEIDREERKRERKAERERKKEKEMKFWDWEQTKNGDESGDKEREKGDWEEVGKDEWLQRWKRGKKEMRLKALLKIETRMTGESRQREREREGGGTAWVSDREKDGERGKKELEEWNAPRGSFSQRERGF